MANDDRYGRLFPPSLLDVDEVLRSAAEAAQWIVKEEVDSGALASTEVRAERQAVWDQIKAALGELAEILGIGVVGQEDAPARRR